jgi:MoaA/NifB/PqqE/SkfB family radical SAM enzyme
MIMDADAISYLQIEPTTRCNFKCKFCAGRHMKQMDMNLGDFEGIVRAFPDIRHIELQGEGEPLLNLDFFNMVELARLHHPHVFISCITNGSLFTPGNIERLLTLQLDVLNVSLESPTPRIFQQLRGGNLEFVLAGMRGLLAERNRRGYTKPAVGFNITILRDTAIEYPAIISLYKELGLDGGLGMQFLQHMDAYTGYYNSEMKGQILLKKETQSLWEKLLNDPKIQEILSQSQNVPNFYKGIFSDRSLNWKGCPWLEKALYISVDSHAASCCYIKDIHRFGFGSLKETTVSQILKKRKLMNQQLKVGNVPTCCRNCPTLRSF